MRTLRPVAVEVRGLRSRRAGGRGANGAELRGLDLSVPVGARLLIVSRPETAASLLLRILAGMVRPADGTISIAGLARPDETAAGWRRRLGYVRAQPAIYPWLSPHEALLLAARLVGFDGAERHELVNNAVERYGLRADARRPIGRGGPAVAQRTALAAAMLTDPEVLLLDEALRSLDPGERRRLLSVPGRRVTVLFASRYPASEHGLVNQVALIRDGRVALHSTVERLRAHDLPLSGRGIEALADLGAADAVAAPAEATRAAADAGAR